MKILNKASFCPVCKVPIIGNSCERCGRPASAPIVPTKLAPVFKEELQMLSEVTGEPVNKFNSLELWTANRYYYYQGRKIFKVIGGNFIEAPKIQWAKNKKLVFAKLEKDERIDEKEYCARIKEANRFALGTLEEKAIRFIHTVIDKFSNEISYKAVSFSGGKDSMVVSHLVRKALGSNGVLHIFTDTTLENPDTLGFVKKAEDKVFLLKAEPQQSFFSLAEKALLPSRIHRWCCTAIKTAPIEKLLKQILEPGERILMFEGTRWEESLKRREYEKIELNSKIALQIIARPILNWSSLEEWLYLLSEGIDVNNSYRYGMRRVGCSLCPLNSSWSEFVLKSLYPDLTEKYIDLLYRFATSQQIEKTIADYIANGQWKTRAGGSGNHKYSLLAEISNWEVDYKFTHIGLNKSIETSTLREYLKPLGKKYKLKTFESQIGSKAILILSKDQRVICKMSMQGNTLDIWWFLKEDKTYRQFLTDLKKQLVKYQFCAYCGGCETKCISHAINVDAKNKMYTVNSDKCIGCGECINIEQVGCLLAKSVKTTTAYKSKEEVING